MPTEIRTFKQDRPADYLRENPDETWRCDIFADDGSDHHGIGHIEGEAIMNAACAYMIYQRRNQRQGVTNDL